MYNFVIFVVNIGHILLRRSSLLLLFVMGETITAGALPHRQDQTPASLKLIVVVVVDQMRSDYLTRFSDLYTGGFHRLLENGANFPNTAYPYSGTYTGPGHAAILSGMLPATTGIVSNSWFMPSLNRSVGCVEDTTVSLVGGKPEEGHSSPKNFFGASFADEFKRGYENSKVISLSIKDRAAILPAGKNPDGTYWFNAATGRFGTSTYYRSSLPSWVTSFNNKQLPSSYLGKTWKKMLPEKAYVRSGKDSARGEGFIPGERASVFPHSVVDGKLISGGTTARFEPLLYTPFGNDLTIAFAETAIDSEMLGRQDFPDMLIVSFSSPDYVGHTFGPESHEIEDMMLQLDRQLDGFMKFLDTRMGLQNTLIALTADHGTSPLPEQHAAEGARRISSKKILDDLRTTTAQRFGYDEKKENIILAYANDYIYVDTVRLARQIKPAITASAFADTVAAHLLTRTEVSRCFTREQLSASIAAGGTGNDSIQSRVEKSFNAQRSGSVAVVLKPYCFLTNDATGSTHGSPYWYDRQVPLLFSGYGIKSGTYTGAATPLDLVPTLAKILGGVSVPTGCAGTPLLDAIQ